MLQSIGLLTNVKEISNENAATKVYILTVGVKNKFRNKGGDHDGQYGRTFVDHKYFASKPEQVKFVEETLRKKVEEKTPLVIESRVQPTQFEKDGKTHYNTDFVVEEIIPYL